MTRQASEWSEQDLDRRFALGPAKDEITQLGNTLDDLLDRLAASLRHEQRLSAEISHELRTPVANISAEAQYALRHGQQSPEDRIVLEHILASARQLGRTLDTLMAAARAQFDLNSATSDAVACAQNATSTAREHHADRKLEFSVLASDKPIRVGAEPELVERILAPLLDNAARHAHTGVHVIVERDCDHVELIVEDDGPGVPEEERDAVFEPGRRARGSAASATLTSHGAGLGLALCRRLARSAGGEVHAGPSDAGGRFIVRLPAA
jgi:signal transduction histidine kinase